MGVHLVSYYNLEDLTSGHLHAPSTFPELASLDISPILLERDFVCPTIVQVRSGPHYQAMGGGHSQMAQRLEKNTRAEWTKTISSTWPGR
ncbi:hypothetical protein C8R44DRAFT_789829 [Mycena epipterygia]|nr:hypothetical protein C8R44DRAFT_789829 [Mycena epipterygia]